MTSQRRRHSDSPESSTLATALLYVRVSGQEQKREGLSLPAQQESVQRYALEHGYVIGGTYTDVMKGTRDDRPQYQALLAEARRLRSERQSVVVIVKWLHRLGRKLLESCRCREEFATLGVEIHSTSEGGVVSDLVANVMASVAQEEVRQLSDRVSETWEYARSRGWHMVGRAPWGYKWRTRTPDEHAAGAPKLVLDVDELAAPYVREAFQRLYAGESERSISWWLATLPAHVRQGLSLDSERTMQWRAVQRMLRSPAYIARDGGVRRERWDVDEVLACPVARWPALIDDDTWRRIQERRQSHQRVPRQASGNYLLTGLIYCHRCGVRMQGTLQTRGPRYRCGSFHMGAKTSNPKCPFVLPTHHADTVVVAEVGALLDSLTSQVAGVRAALERAWLELDEPNAPDQRARIADLEHKLTEVRDRVTRATGLFVDGAITKQAYDDLCRTQQEEAEASEAELRRLRNVQPVRRVPPLDDTLATAGSWAKTFRSLDLSHRRPQTTLAQREVLALLINRVEPVRVAYATYRIDIQWTALGTALRLMARSVLAHSVAA